IWCQGAPAVVDTFITTWAVTEVNRNQFSIAHQSNGRALTAQSASTQEITLQTLNSSDPLQLWQFVGII
ncbi:hypothetical protein EXIGLDRAFT_752764, partial [Exidia glandulosa HHB12029]